MVSAIRLFKFMAIILSSAAISCTIWSVSPTVELKHKAPEQAIVTQYEYKPSRNENELYGTERQQEIYNLVNTVDHSSIFLSKHGEILFQWFKDVDESIQSIISFLSQPIINYHNFRFVHNNKSACTFPRMEVLIMVPSAPENFRRRSLLRKKYYGAFLKNEDNRAKLLFFLGFSKSAEIQNRIEEEINTFRDIVQESFDDNYHNIRFKAVSMLKWARTFCRQAKFVIRNDDDIVVNMTSVVETVKRTSLRYANFIIGKLRVGDMPDRVEVNKNYLSKMEYPEPTFPPYALGGLLGYPMMTVELLYQAALRVKPIWLDDVYITGICAPNIGAELLTHPTFKFKHII